MDPSQLRLLANDRAQGLLDDDAYRARRRELIDALVAGELPIVREAPVAHEPDIPTGGDRRIFIRLLAGAGVVALILLGYGLLDRSQQQPESPATMPQEVSAPRSTVTPARFLVESFLARRDFGPDALTRFETAWAALPAADHRLASQEPWFASLGGAVQTEVLVQSALADLGDNAAAAERGARVARFAERIGISLDAPPAPDDDDEEDTRPSPDPAPTIDANEWLAIQPDENVTLQLFAVNALTHVGQLVNSYPSLDLHVLGTRGTPRYRVVLGSFTDVDTARSTFESLPQVLRDASGGAIIKSMPALRDDLAAAATPSKSSDPGPDTRHFTLQLFATHNPEGARALADANPDLALEVVQVADSRTPHRVLLGRFADIDAAAAAREQLPPALLARVGRPLIKRRDHLDIVGSR